MAVHKDTHEFAVYKESLSLLLQKQGPGSSVIFSDEKLFHRMVTVLRLRVGDGCIFFDKERYIVAKIESFVGKKQIQVIVESVHPTTILRPNITFLLPMLKRDDYESALYALTEVGVSTIQLVFTQKTGNCWSKERDNDRAQRILIAAAEQSKNFAYPRLKAPISLEVALQEQRDVGGGVKIFFDPQGSHFFDVMNRLHDDRPEHVVLLIGPEGDLTLEEKKMVRTNKFIFCALTPTIMRAVQAAALAAGFVRSLLV